MNKAIYFVVILLNVIPAQGVDTNYVLDVRGENIFHFSINPKLPLFKFILIGDSAQNIIDTIKIYSINKKIPLQTVYIDDMDSPVKGHDYFLTSDFNFDGNEDIMLLKYWGVTGNLIYKVWLFKPQRIKFESNKFLSNIRSPKLNKNKKELTTYYRNGFNRFTSSTYKVINGKYEQIKEVSQYWDAKLKCFF